MTRFAAAALVVALAVVGGTARAEASVTDEIAQALLENNVYVDPDAERAITAADAEEVREATRRVGTPIYIAIVPDSMRDAAGGDAGVAARQIAEGVGRPGTFGIVVGDSFRAGSDLINDASALAGRAEQGDGDDTTTVLLDFVRLVGAEAAAVGGSGEDGSDGGNGWVLPVVLAAGVAVIALLLWRGRRRRQAAALEAARRQQADRQLLQAELSVLADDVVRLEPEVGLHPDARPDFDAAVNRCRAATAALEAADEAVDLVRVERVVQEARYLMDRAAAVVDEQEPPEPPSELRQPGRHGEPAVTLDDSGQPTYVGYPGGFQDGWFGGVGGGLFSGLLLGSALGWGFGGWGSPATVFDQEDDGSGEGGGDADDGGRADDDWNGGDWGGGDFGGGDFGG